MMMFTLLYPWVHWFEVWEGERSGVVCNPRVDTLAEVLRNAGYATAAFTGGAHMNRARGFDQGFQRYRHDDQLRRSREWLRAHAGHCSSSLPHLRGARSLPTAADLAKQFDGDYGDGPIRSRARIRAGASTADSTSCSGMRSIGAARATSGSSEPLRRRDPPHE
jgi:hypothetical protein